MANNNAKDFVKKWSGRGNEKQETQQFWNDIIFKVLNAPSDTQIEYEKKVKINGQTKFIDAYLPATKTLIEQKSLGIDLMKAELQSDGMKLTPYEQGRRYGGYLPYDEQPRWIVDSNFEEIRVHDMKKPGDPPEVIKLKDMDKDYTRLMFLVNSEDEHLKKELEVSVKAGEIVGVLYDKLLEQFATPEAGAIVGEMYNKMRETYDNPNDEHVLQSLNKLCVRIVFCLYAEDAGLFGNNRHAFHDYMDQFNGPARFRKGLKELFEVLNQKPEERDRYIDPELAAFPYVNGGLFADEKIEFPYFTEEIVNIILERASSDFDWSDISPTIFGSIFESTLNPETRRSGGMHYTSIENIHKVIDPLFLDDLKVELASIKAEPIDKVRTRKLRNYQEKLSSLKFLDPACGSGNFLTESYLCLRRLENEVIDDLHKGQIMMAFDETPNPIKVSINQFYGIEINDFACSVAQTAMWIAESKMLKETEAIVKQDFDFFPLTNNANIVEGNALRIDWNDVVSSRLLNYIMGNPPFVGYAYQSAQQKEDLRDLNVKSNNIDYVVGWYYKACDYIKDTDIACAFVSTNSICQGEQACSVWKPLIEEYGICITFAHRTFIWDSEATTKAHVHCVIVGFSNSNVKSKKLYNKKVVQIASNINPYLLDAPNVFIEKRKKPLANVEEMIKGSQPTDGGNLIIEADDYESFILKEPCAINYIRKLIGASEFINNKKRYCLWLEGISPQELKTLPSIKDRVQKVKEFRLKSTKAATRKWADYPMLFTENRQPASDYLVVPRVSSENRRYIPIGYISKDVIATDSCMTVSNATTYTFGVLSSNVHNAWMRTVCGRLKSDYRYSNTIVYNNFPWPIPNEEQRSAIEHTAKAILDARANYPSASLADLYDELAMPIDLRKAHQANDRAVMDAYGFSLKMTEQECVAELMKMYQKLTEEV